MFLLLGSIHVFPLRGFIFYDIHKKTRKEFKQFRLQNTKNIWRQNLLAQRTFGAKVHKSNIPDKRWRNKYEIIN